MNALIKEFLDEHKKLFEMLDTLRNIGAKGAKESLFGAKDLFISHLQKEDQLLYSKFDEAQKHGVNVPENVIAFKKDMETISKETFDFFKKYSDSIIDNLQFAKDYGKIYSMLKIRMAKEELQLYPTYEKYFS